MLRYVILFIVFIISYQVKAEDKVSMVCEWNLFSASFPEHDTFIFDIENETVLWVDEEIILKLIVTEGLLKFKGIPSSRVRIDKNKYKTHIPIQFALNRITGGLKVTNEYGKANPFAKCLVKPHLL